jgi:hypothetical protein
MLMQRSTKQHVSLSRRENEDLIENKRGFKWVNQNKILTNALFHIPEDPAYSTPD